MSPVSGEDEFEFLVDTSPPEPEPENPYADAFLEAVLEPMIQRLDAAVAAVREIREGLA